MSSNQSISMMDGTYFVGRQQILDWINTVTDLQLTKIEQTASGAVACQIIDSIYPMRFPMAKVDWSANKDYEYITNYKVLQMMFTKLKIERHIEVDRLIRGKYQDNFEFMQWFKRFHDLNNGGTVEMGYDAVGQRAKGKGGAAFTKQYGSPSAVAAKPLKIRQRPRPPRAATSEGGNRSQTNAPPAPTPVPTTTTTPGNGAPSMNRPSRRATPSSTESNSSEKEKVQIENLKNELKKQQMDAEELRLTMDALEKERDFYFTKLRDIEVSLQEKDEVKNSEIAKSVFAILYATDDECIVENDSPSNAMEEDEQVGAPALEAASTAETATNG